MSGRGQEVTEMLRFACDPAVRAQREARRSPPEVLEAVAAEVEARRSPGWWLRATAPDGECWDLTQFHLRMIWSLAVEADGRPWLHVSVSHRKRLPNRDEMARVKDWVFGPERYAYEVWPTADRYVNLR